MKNVLPLLALLHASNLWASPAFTGPQIRRVAPTLLLPSSYEQSRQKWPLLLVLHGFTANGEKQVDYFGLTNPRARKGFIVLAPNGLKNSAGLRYWNAGPVCCDFEEKNPDDVDYLKTLIEDTVSRYRVDRQRIYILGYSNGGFMAHRLACEHPGLFAAVASFAGAGAMAGCPAGKAVSFAQIHVKSDPLIFYEGGTLPGRNDPFPGARQSAQDWADRNGCQGPRELGRIDMIAQLVLAGADTTRERWSRCRDRKEVELWSIDGHAVGIGPNRSHVPFLAPGATNLILNEFLFKHALTNN